MSHAIQLFRFKEKHAGWIADDIVAAAAAFHEEAGSRKDQDMAG